MGMMGMLRGNFLQIGGSEIVGKSWESMNESLTVVFIRTVSKSLRDKHVPRLARTEGEIGNRWIVVHVWESDEEVQGIGWNRR